MKVSSIQVTMLHENCYFYYNEQTLECLMVDPGGDVEKLIKFIDEHKLKVRTILLTHGHFDHIQAVPRLKELYNPMVYAHVDEKVFLAEPTVNMSYSMARHDISMEADQYLDDGDLFSFDDEEFVVLHTPGHTPGGCCYYSEKGGIVFTGDTLFREDVGRSDFTLGNYEHLINGIVTKLYKLPKETIAYPGHGPSTTIGHEMVNNPYAKGAL